MKKKETPATLETRAGQSSPSSDKKKTRQGQSTEVIKRPQERRAVQENAILGYVKKGGQFLREARTELKKVKWPTRKELLASTAVVIFLVLLVSLFLGLVDFGLIKIIKNILG